MTPRPVVAYTMSGLSRKLRHSLAAKRELSRLGVEVHYASEADDPTTPQELLVWSVWVLDNSPNGWPG